MLPGGAIAGFLIVPMLLLGGICFLESAPARIACTAALVLWLASAIAVPVFYQAWGWLIAPELVIVLWLFLAEIKRMFKD